MSVTILPVPRARTIHRPYLALAGLQVMDVLTTGLVLEWFAAMGEGNPIAKVLTDLGIPGLGVLLLFKLGVVALLWACQSGVRLASALYSLVIANNVLALALLVTS